MLLFDNQNNVLHTVINKRIMTITFFVVIINKKKCKNALKMNFSQKSFEVNLY